MARYAISEEGAVAMESLSASLKSSIDGLRQASLSLRNSILGCMDALGVYGTETWSIALELSGIVETYEDTLISLSESAKKKSDDIRRLLSADSSESSASAGSFSGSRNGGSREYSSVVRSLQNGNVDYLPIQKAPAGRSSSDIINSLCGGDKTDGSCSSLALAYAGNKAGYAVLDFRDGNSRKIFSLRDTVRKIACLPGVDAVINKGRNDIECANSLLGKMEEGKEYYLATGQHAAIVRINGDHYEYLELQHQSYGNGWQYLDNFSLRTRFNCNYMHWFSFSNFLIDVDSLAQCQEFLDILGYINTDSSEQQKGDDGHVS